VPRKGSDGRAGSVARGAERIRLLGGEEGKDGATKVGEEEEGGKKAQVLVVRACCHHPCVGGGRCWVEEEIEVLGGGHGNERISASDAVGRGKEQEREVD